MKKFITVLFLVSFSAVIFLTGCRKEETPVPGKDQAVSPTEPAPAPGEPD